MRLVTSGFKGCDHNLTLGQHTLLAGPCGTGKTSVLDAITWIFLGHLPRLGKKHEATADLMRGRAMSAELTLDDGRTIVRELERTKRDSLSQSVRCSWLPEGANQDEHEAACLLLVGGDAETAAEALDIRSLIHATGPRRASRIQQILSAGAMTADERTVMVAEFTARRLVGKEDAEIANWKSLVPLIPGTSEDGQHKGVRRILGAVQGELRSTLVNGGLSAAKAWSNANKNRASGEARTKRQAHVELEARLGELAEVDVEALADDEARLRGLDEQIGAQRAAAEQAKAQAARREQAQGAVYDAQIREQQAQSDAEAVEAVAAIRAEQEAELATLQAEMATLPDFVPVPFDATEYQARVDAAHGAWQEASERRISEPSDADLRVERAALAGLERQLANVEADPWCQVAAGVSTIYDALPKITKTGPARAQLLTVCEELLTLAGEQGAGDEAAIREQIEAATRRVANLAEEYDVRRASYDTAREGVGALLRAYHDAKGALDAAEAAHRAEQIGARQQHHASDAGQRRAAACDRAMTLRELLSRPAPNAEAAAERLRSAQAATQAARQRLAEIPAASEVAVDTSERDALAADIRTKRDVLAKRSELEKLVEDLAKADAEREVYAAIEWACTQALAREANDASRALLDPMREFLRAAGRNEDPFCEATGSDFRIGWRKPSGDEVSVKTLCGGEWPVFVAAFASAVHSVGNAPLRLVLTEAGETDDTHLGQIIRGLSSLAGVSSIVAVQRIITTEPTGWTLVQTGERLAVAA